jgi:hypothetical protein
MKPLIFVPAAKEEMVEATTFYEARARNLGAVFLRSIEEHLDQIQRTPSAAPVVWPGIRRKMLLKFPYAVLYHDGPDEITVVAIAHLHRLPNYWSDRL